MIWSGRANAQQNGKEFSGCDSVITFSLDNIGSEGAEARVCYQHGLAARAGCTVFGAAGKTEYIFDIHKDKLTVHRNDFTYGKPIDEVKSDEDILLSHDTVYIVPRLSTDGEDLQLFQAIMVSVQ